MIDKDFYYNHGPYSLDYIASNIGCKVLAPINSKEKKCETLIQEISSLDSRDKDFLAFLSNIKYTKDLVSSLALACIVDRAFSQELAPKKWLLVSDDPYYSYKKAIDLFYSPRYMEEAGIAPTAILSPSAKLGKNCSIGHNVVIYERAVIGDDTVIGDNSVIGAGVKIGNRVKIGFNVSIKYSIIGNEVVILSGARIGEDGFGFAQSKGVYHKIFHTGIVIIEDGVEVGANTTIDRGSLQNTKISKNTKLDNLVQVGHNVTIGQGSIIVAQVGIAGSVTIGNYCAMGGQVGIAGHLKIGDKVQVAAKSGVIRDLPGGATYAGIPAVPSKDWLKSVLKLKSLIYNK